MELLLKRLLELNFPMVFLMGCMDAGFPRIDHLPNLLVFGFHNIVADHAINYVYCEIVFPPLYLKYEKES